MNVPLRCPVPRVSWSASRLARAADRTLRTARSASRVRACWRRQRLALCVALVAACAALWALRWHEAELARVEREAEGAARAAALFAGRPVSMLVTGCSPKDLSKQLAIAAGEFDALRLQLESTK